MLDLKEENSKEQEEEEDQEDIEHNIINYFKIWKSYFYIKKYKIINNKQYDQSMITYSLVFQISLN